MDALTKNALTKERDVDEYVSDTHWCILISRHLTKDIKHEEKEYITKNRRGKVVCYKR